MPYTDPRARERLEEVIDPHGECGDFRLMARACDGPGDLNYLVTTLCAEYLDHRGLGYANINEVVGVLDCAKLELYRRIAVPYEDTKIIENGDVYPKSLVMDVISPLLKAYKRVLRNPENSKAAKTARGSALNHPPRPRR